MEDWRYWTAIVGAAAMKVLLSQTLTFKQACLTFVMGIGAAWLFTDPLIDWAGLNPDVYKTPTAAILALTGEQIVRRIIRYSQRPGGSGCLTGWWMWQPGWTRPLPPPLLIWKPISRTRANDPHL